MNDFDPKTAAREALEQGKHQPNGQVPQISYTLLDEIKPCLERDDIVRDLIPRRAFGEVHSDSAVGKTAILIDLGLHVADGREYRGRRVDRQPVVFIAFEGHGGIDNRVYAAKQELGITSAPFALIKIATTFRDPEVAKRIAEIAAELMRGFGGDCPLVVIDTYTAALGAGSSDSDPKDVSVFIANVQNHLLVSCTVVIAHHFGKDQSRGGRGWSGLRASLDFELEIDQDDDLRTMRLTKSRDGSDRQPALCYRFRGREVGLNKHDEPVTAVVVEHLADAAEPGKRMRHSPKARALLNLLWTMIKDPKRSHRLPDHEGLRCTLHDDLERDAIKPGVVSQCTSERDRRKVFVLALNELVEANAVQFDQGRVWPLPAAEREVEKSRNSAA
jgi:hypothetical protein